MTPSHVLEARLARLEAEQRDTRRVVLRLTSAASFSAGATAACIAALAMDDPEQAERFSGVLERLAKVDEDLSAVLDMLSASSPLTVAERAQAAVDRRADQPREQT